MAKWIVNHYQKSWAHDTIERLRNQVRKPSMHDDPELKQTLLEMGYFD